jgi:hypothetical protein
MLKKATLLGWSTKRLILTLCSPDLWYNDDLGWAGLASDTGKGGRLVYRRI